MLLLPTFLLSAPHDSAPRTGSQTSELRIWILIFHNIPNLNMLIWCKCCKNSRLYLFSHFGNSFICPTRSGTTEIYIFGPAGAGIQNKICNIHLIDIVLQVQKYLEVQVFLVLQKYLEYQKQWNCSKLSERDTDMQNNIVKLRQRVRQG